MKTGLIKIETQDLKDSWRIAEMAAKSDMVPAAFKNRPENIMIAWQYGYELGISPMASLQNIAVINGRPCIWGDMMLAIARNNPEFEDIKETVEDVGGVLTARCEVKRKNQTRIVHTFSLDDAKKAGLAGRDVWTKYTKRMLQMRARSYALRDAFSDSLAGFRMVEEEQDVDLKDITPKTKETKKQSISELIPSVKKEESIVDIYTEKELFKDLNEAIDKNEVKETVKSEVMSPIERAKAMQQEAELKYKTK
jgi:hypothetical protein